MEEGGNPKDLNFPCNGVKVTQETGDSTREPGMEEEGFEPSQRPRRFLLEH